MDVKVTHFSAFILMHLVLTTGGESETVKLLLELNTGPIRGQVVTGFTQKDSRAFYGIPYAEPPLGKLRFKPPVPVKPWSEVLDATKTPLPCYQQYTKHLRRLSEMTNLMVRRPWSEDCLTLNVWAPAITPEDAPVLIYIHDGAFMTGSGAYPYFELSTFSAETEEISISINYRLGAFGFLTLGTSDVPGNLGLMDQQLALRWVRENVATFGGKTEAIFFVGLGAGAASIGHQIISTNNAGLFKTGVMFSGSAVCPWAWQTKEKAVHLAKQLSQVLGCESENTSSELECLQNVHPEDIVDAFYHVPVLDIFKPNIDGSFIKEDPEEAMKAGRFNNVTIVIANALRASSLRFQEINEDILTEPGPGLTEEGFEEAMRRVRLGLTSTELALAKEWYLRKDCLMNETEIREVTINAYSDALGFCCSDEFLKYATENGVLTYKIILDVPDNNHPSWIGAHDLIAYPILTAEALNPLLNFSSGVKQGAMQLIQFCKVFARKKARELQEIVPIYNLEDQPYLYWGVGQQYFGNNFRRRECVLWNKIIPELRRGKKSCGSE